MRVFVVEPDGAGGLIHYAHQLCETLQGAGAEVTLLTGQHYELADVPASFEVRPELRLWPAIEPPLTGRLAGLRHRIRRVGRGIRLFREWWRLTSIVISERPDVAQFSIIRFPFLGLFLWRIRRAGIVTTQICHEYELRDATGPVRRAVRALSRRIIRSFTAVFAHGESQRRAVIATTGAAPERVHAIPHGDEGLLVRMADAGGDLRERHGIPADRPVVVFFGGLRPSKGLPDLIEAMAGVTAEVDAHLLIAGHPEGVDPAALRTQAVRFGVAHRTTVDARYLPFGDIGPLMRTATAVALPYRSATASGILQTAYAFGRPVVATAVGALAEDVVHGETGLLVPPGDTAALARALVKVLSDPAESLAMGEAARRHASDFGWGPIAARILEVYEGLGKTP
jgi:glycosyltransferase involved in cell wall biosynthesis